MKKKCILRKTHFQQIFSLLDDDSGFQLKTTCTMYNMAVTKDRYEGSCVDESESN